jgi:hypothetical protein
MTETEWLECDYPNPMLTYLGDRFGDRKCRLFSCACCWRLWELLNDGRSRLAIEVAERFADGRVSWDELLVHAQEAQQVSREEPEWVRDVEGAHCDNPGLAAALAVANAVSLELDMISAGGVGGHCAWSAALSARSAIEASAVQCTGTTMAGDAASEAEARWQAELLRCLFGNPFRSVDFDPAWCSSVVASLGQAIYEDRRFDRLPILADALEDAGCNDRSLLDHLRGPGPHARGCFVLDLLLDKQ